MVVVVVVVDVLSDVVRAESYLPNLGNFGRNPGDDVSGVVVSGSRSTAP